MAALSVSFALFCTGLAYLAPQFCPCNKSSRSYVFITCRYSTRCSGVSRQFGICHLHYCIRPKYQSLATDSCRQVIYLLLCCFLTTGLMILVNHAARYIKQINRTKTTWLGYDMFFPNFLTYERTRWLTDRRRILICAQYCLCQSQFFWGYTFLSWEEGHAYVLDDEP